MVKVITYGTFDLLHYGHIRLLERAKKLGDYLVVGVTSDDFDKTRGKINNQQSLMERVAAVEALGIADEVIVEEYVGQKIDDIIKNEIDIFAIGSDWIGKFDYLNEYCKVVYLDRTEGVSSSEIRTDRIKIKVGIVGNTYSIIKKFIDESKFVNGIEISGFFLDKKTEELIRNDIEESFVFYENYEELLNVVDAVYISSTPDEHYAQIVMALNKKINVLCEAPLCMNKKNAGELFELAVENDCILCEATKTAFATAYQRLLLLLKSGSIGKIMSVNATCTSLNSDFNSGWTGFSYWGVTAMLPVFQILGTEYKDRQMVVSNISDNKEFVKIDFLYSDAVASIMVGTGIKSEGELIISGTKGYVYVPAPWWKTDYFEIRYENAANNKRFFYQLDGEGIRYEIVDFVQSISNKKTIKTIDEKITIKISQIMEEYSQKKNVVFLD